MTESKFETVSSFVDNEMQHDESFDELIKDSELSDTWGRYQLMGDIIRNEVPQTIQLDLSSKISEAIENELTVLAPKNIAKNENSFKARIVNFVKPLGQVAIAASAAGLMVLGVQQSHVVQTDDVAPIQNIQTSPFVGMAEPVSFNFQQPETKLSQQQAYIEQQRRLQALLVDHKQQIKLTSVKTEQADKIAPLSTEIQAVEAQNNKVENLPK